MKICGVSEHNLPTSGAGKAGKLTGQNEGYVSPPTRGKAPDRGAKTDSNSTSRGGGPSDNDQDD